MNGTYKLVSGKIAQSKTKGRAFVEELSRASGHEKIGADKLESKKTKHGKHS